MAFEIEMLSVKAADAIIIRYFNEKNNEIVILIDAGRKEDGKKVAMHIEKWTKKKSIDLAICTHPDDDHIGGFFHIVNEVPIQEFWIHDPSKHQIEVQAIMENISSNSVLEGNLKNLNETLSDCYNLINLIDSKGTIRRDREPFEGLEYEKAPLKILGPSKKTYEQLLSKYRDVSFLLENETKSPFIDGICLEGTLNNDMLKKYNDQSKENNSSVITFFTPDNLKYLFTADTKSEFLLEAHKKYNLANLHWLQIPHHGSKYNINKSVIKILNPAVAYISCDGSVNYPNSIIIDELKAICCTIYSTARSNLLRRKKTLKREGYNKATPL